MLFGKNSDRQRNEAQRVELHPRIEHPAGASLRCTYVSIPQVARTNAVLLSRPFWIWGAEMGANEHGVVVGNEGLRSRAPAPEEPALIGMDLLRLALERAATAGEAVEVITTLLERHGQGGNCGHLIPSYYHNSFMVADRHEAFVLETVGREWLCERVRHVRAISNDYSVAGTIERTSAGLPHLLRELGAQETSTNYAEVFANPQTAHIGSARPRRARATSLLRAREGVLTLRDILRTLRDHDPAGGGDVGWDPKRPHQFSLCIHAGADEKTAQTTAAMASEIRAQSSVHWMTGTAATCLSIFKPVLLDAALPPHGPPATDRFDPQTLWWRHERMHRAAILGDFSGFLQDIAIERDALEAQFHSRVTAVLDGGSRTERSRVIGDCWAKAMEVEDRWCQRITAASSNPAEFVSTWEKMNRLACFPGSISE